jgi:hypothetical protein
MSRAIYPAVLTMVQVSRIETTHHQMPLLRVNWVHSSHARMSMKRLFSKREYRHSRSCRGEDSIDGQPYTALDAASLGRHPFQVQQPSQQRI